MLPGPVAPASLPRFLCPPARDPAALAVLDVLILLRMTFVQAALLGPPLVNAPRQIRRLRWRTRRSTGHASVTARFAFVPVTVRCTPQAGVLGRVAPPLVVRGPAGTSTARGLALVDRGWEMRSEGMNRVTQQVRPD